MKDVAQYGKLLSRAIAFAAQKHSNQVDTQKLPYILHPIAVMQKVFAKTRDVDFLITAVLHDVVEDCEVSVEEIQGAFGYTVASAVACLSKNVIHLKTNPLEKTIDYSFTENDAQVPMFAYADRIKENNVARIVKIADLEHNASLDRMPDYFEQTEKTIKKLQDYQKLYSFLVDMHGVVKNPFLLGD